MIMVLIGKRIKELRNKYKLTQTELAEQVGVTKSTIAAYENDSRQPSYEVLIKMAAVFRVSIDSLLLDRQGSILEVSHLNKEQLDIIENLIMYFRKSNAIDIFMLKNAPELVKYMQEYPDMTIEEIIYKGMD